MYGGCLVAQFGNPPKEHFRAPRWLSILCGLPRRQQLGVRSVVTQLWGLGAACIGGLELFGAISDATAGVLLLLLIVGALLVVSLWDETRRTRQKHPHQGTDS